MVHNKTNLNCKLPLLIVKLQDNIYEYFVFMKQIWLISIKLNNQYF